MPYKITKTLDSLQDTLALAALIGSKLRGNEVIELVSDLGGGKTTFVKGIAKSAGSIDYISSPSFTIRNDYKTRDFTIAHFDFYRLNDPGIMSDMLAEAINDPATVVIIEWGGIVADVLPVDRISIKLNVRDINSRQAEIEIPNNYDYLYEVIK